MRLLLMYLDAVQDEYLYGSEDGRVPPFVWMGTKDFLEICFLEFSVLAAERKKEKNIFFGER